MGSGDGHHVIARIVVFILNFAFWASGILLIVFGSIALADPSMMIDMLNMIDGVSNVTGVIPILDLFFGMSIFMIVLGSFLFLLGGNGCHGAVRIHKKSIMAYMVCLIICTAVEVALIIYGCVYPGMTEEWIQTEMQKSLNKSFVPVDVDKTTGELFYSDDSVAYSWEKLQFETKCCGGLDFTDYNAIEDKRNGWEFEYPAGVVYLGPNVPPSCCVTGNDEGQVADNFADISYPDECLRQDQPPSIDPNVSYNEEGCWKTAYDMVWQFNMIAIIISAILIGAQILAFIFSIPLWRD